MTTRTAIETRQGVALKVDTLEKRYPGMDVNAVDGVTFEVSTAEVFALLGPNGAGKTTTVGIITTTVRPTGGRAEIAGIDVVRHPVQARAHLAVVPQRSNLDRAISIRQNLLFHAAYHGVPVREREDRADRLLEQFGLADRAHIKPDFFSGGQSQRVMIARALMHAPTVLFLDEPTTGLDPAARLFVWDRLQELRDAGTTLLLTTHDMDEAAALADRVGIMDHGKLLALDTPEALTRALPGSRTLELALTGLPERLEEAMKELAVLDRVERVEQIHPGGPGPAGPQGDGAAAAGGASRGGGPRVRLYVTGEAPPLVAPAAEILGRHRLELTDIKLGEPSLEDVFIELTGRTLR